MAPVTGGIADGQKDRLVLALRRLERLRTPGTPPDRVVGVLQEIGTFFGAEPVGGLSGCHGPHPPAPREFDRSDRTASYFRLRSFRVCSRVGHMGNPTNAWRIAPPASMK